MMVEGLAQPGPIHIVGVRRVVWSRRLHELRTENTPNFHWRNLFQFRFCIQG